MSCKNCDYYFDNMCYCNESTEFLYSKNDDSDICGCFEPDYYEKLED